jgi:hypothetical protein
MMKNSMFLLIALLAINVNAQVGIGTNNPQGELHIDGAKDNAISGTPTIAQQKNDVIITNTGKVGIGTITPHASSALEVNSASNGFLPPRMTNIQMLAITAPTQGLVVYCTNCTPKGLRVFDGIYWTDMIGTNPKSKILYQWDFEGFLPLPNLKYEQASGQNNITIVTDPLNLNNKVLKTIIPAGLDRSEVYLGESLYGQILHFYADANFGFTDAANTVANNLSLGSEIWLKMRVYKPQEQNTNGIKPCIVQFGPVGNVPLTTNQLGFAQVRLRNDTSSYGDRWNWRLFSNNIFTPFPITPGEVNFVTKPYGVWETFVLHLKYRTDSEGILEVWKDGVKYITQNGANAIPNNRGKIKFGLYIGAGNSVPQTLTCYFDDVKIGGANCSYEEISQ